jgi:predicted SAM-dependent methyltransferase
MRSITSYIKIQQLLGNLLRDRAFQARSRKLVSRKYLDLGCGPCPKPGFVNLDYRWRPGVDVVWDILRPLPFPSDRFAGVFTEHCLEHFDLKQLDGVLKEIHRILQPGGVLRIVVPNLAKYVDAYSRRMRGEKFEDEQKLATASAFNRVFYSGHVWMSRSRWWNDGHHFIHDFESLSKALLEAGFRNSEERQLLAGSCSELLIDREDRAWESLYVEAVK